jgi:hypothetical protein
MSRILQLPTEVLAQIVRTVSLHGDLTNWRGTHPALRAIADSQSRVLVEDLRIQSGISLGVLDVFLAADDISMQTGAVNVYPGRLQVLTAFVRDTVCLTAGGNQSGESGYKSSRIMAHKEALMLFAIFSRTLKSSMATTHSTMSDVLVAPSEGPSLLSWQFSAEFCHYIEHEMTLLELESIIRMVSICTHKLWNWLLTNSDERLPVQTFGSLSGAILNSDQAVLTEQVIWNGPLWVSSMLAQPNNPAEGKRAQLDGILMRNVGKADAARLAANGVARYLWRERQRKIDKLASQQAQAVVVNDLRIDSAGFRGGAGDM